MSKLERTKKETVLIQYLILRQLDPHLITLLDDDIEAGIRFYVSLRILNNIVTLVTLITLVNF